MFLTKKGGLAVQAETSIYLVIYCISFFAQETYWNEKPAQFCTERNTQPRLVVQ